MVRFCIETKIMLLLSPLLLSPYCWIIVTLLLVKNNLYVEYHLYRRRITFHSQNHTLTDTPYTYIYIDTYIASLKTDV